MPRQSNECGAGVTHTCPSCGDKQGVCGIEDGQCWFTDGATTDCDGCNSTPACDGRCWYYGNNAGNPACLACATGVLLTSSGT